MSAGDITAEESEEVGMAVGLSCAFQEGRTTVPGPVLILYTRTRR